MKIKYSIINAVNSDIGELSFTLILSVADYIILQQYKAQQREIKIPVRTDEFIEYERNPDIIKNSAYDVNGFISIKLHPDNFSSQNSEIGELTWISKIYRFKRSFEYGQMKELLNQVIAYIAEEMRKLKKNIPEHNYSCWETEEDIEY